MRAYDIIYKKRNGEILTKEEIEFMVLGFAEDKIPDYQMAAFLMAVFLNKFTGGERAYFTDSMLNSGRVVDLSSIPGIKVDKHSTGGVGDGVSLSLAPMVACTGIPIPMMSGRGLGHTGGTLDKLESIPGYSVLMDQSTILNALEKVGVIIMGQTDDICPADKKMYALRDVTATVDSIDLIAGSIMSKKLAEGMDALILDVKTGEGAFMQEYNDSVNLAKAMVEIGVNLDKNMMALITDMNQPLGRAVGNALEINQAVDILKNEGPPDITKLVLTIGAHMVYMGGKASTVEEGMKKCRNILESGEGLEKFKDMAEIHGGNPAALDDRNLMPQAAQKIDILASKDGFITDIKARDIGIAASLLGAGRERIDSKLDYAVGTVLDRKAGDEVKKGDRLAVLHVNDTSRLDESRAMVEKAFTISDDKPEIPPLIYSKVTIDNTIEINEPRP